MTVETRLGVQLDAPETHEAQETPRWSPVWDRCQACGTQEMPHRGRGLCSLCYVRLRMFGLLPPLTGYVVAGSRNGGAWSRDYDACQVCGTTERPHHARGLCARCYARWLRARRALQNASAPAAVPRVLEKARRAEARTPTEVSTPLGEGP